MTQDETIIANAYRLPSYMTPSREIALADDMAARCRNEGHRPQIICNSRLTAEAQSERTEVVADRLYAILCEGQASMSDIRQRTQVHSAEITAALARLHAAGKLRSWEINVGSKCHRVMYGAIQ